MTGVGAKPRAVQALKDAAGASSVLVLGLHDVDDGAWHVLTAAGLRLMRVAGVPAVPERSSR